MGHRNYMVGPAFGDAAIEAVIGSDVSQPDEFSDEQVREIAKHSTHRFWVKDGCMYGIEEMVRNVAGMLELSAADALAQYGVEHLWEARERARSHLGKPVRP